MCASMVESRRRVHSPKLLDRRFTHEGTTRVGYEAAKANGAAMNIATMKTNNASIRDVRRYDESIFRMMRVEGT